MDAPPAVSVDMPQTTLAPVIEAVTCLVTFTPKAPATDQQVQAVVVSEAGQRTTPIGDFLFETSLKGDPFATGELTLSVGQSPDFPVLFSARYRFPADPYINSFEAADAGFTGELTVLAPSTLSQLTFSCAAK